MMCGLMWTCARWRPAEGQLESDALHRRLRPCLVEDEVAERVPDRLALVDLHRGGPVGMVADDHVGPRIDDHPGQILLRGERGRVVLGAPMGEDDDDIGACGPGGRDILFHEVRLQRRAADLRRCRVVAAGDRVVRKDRDLGPACFEDAGFAGRCQVLAGARNLDAALRDVLDRLEEAGPAGIPDVVVGERDVVDAGVLQPVDQLRVG